VQLYLKIDLLSNMKLLRLFFNIPLFICIIIFTLIFYIFKLLSSIIETLLLTPIKFIELKTRKLILKILESITL
jgi:hypothetical protein